MPIARAIIESELMNLFINVMIQQQQITVSIDTQHA